MLGGRVRWHDELGARFRLNLNSSPGTLAIQWALVTRDGGGVEGLQVGCDVCMMSEVRVLP